jgi:CubicO group peptidase (beta-lactamase class C family)
MRARRTLLPLLLLLSSLAAGGTPPAYDLDTFIRTEMSRRQIPGLSIAIIQDGRIVEARAYGVTEKGGTAAVTPNTLFQAGSISKSVAAVGALRLVERGTLSLDTDVNATLTTWKVPANAFTAAHPVTLRGILSHTAGFTVHGFPGYATDSAMPSLVQVLDGAPPANTAAIRVDTVPGSRWQYSGGGYTVMQQMMLDATHQPFPELMRQTVLAPIGMRASSFEQPQPPARAALTAVGHYGDRSLVEGRWHVYPEMAAAGLWTTPSDLARFVIDVQRTLAGKSAKVISRAMARQMVTEVRDGDGLGVFLQGTGRGLQFNHGGRDEGFDALMLATAETGQGVVIMINANDDSRMMGRLAAFVARKYGWPDTAPATAGSATASESVAPALLGAYAGYYELRNNQIITLVSDDTVLATMPGGFPDERFVPQGADRFASADRNAEFTVTKDAAGAVTALAWRDNGAARAVPRIGPLARTLSPAPDPDTVLTARIAGALQALAQGGEAVAGAAALTEGARRDFGAAGPWQDLAGLGALSYLHREDVAGRGIERHGSPVAAIVYYRAQSGGRTRILIIHLTPDGAVTDFDPVDP